MVRDDRFDLAGLGISVVQQRFIPNLRAEGKDGEADGLIGATTRLSMVAAIAGSLLLFAYLYWPGKNAMDGPTHASRSVVIALAVVVRPVEDERRLSVLSER